MAPSIALRALETREGKLKVLDPMSGSGTVLAVANSRGHEALGFDLDPLAVLLGSVWTRAIHRTEFVEIATQIIKRAQRRSKCLARRDLVPIKADAETRDFVRYWFDSKVRRGLRALSEEISKVDNRAHREALWCAFSRMIITKSGGVSLAMDISHSRPHRVRLQSKVDPFDRFAREIQFLSKNLINRGKRAGPRSRVSLGDARDLPLDACSVDFVITSPPYLNAIDYIRTSKFSLVWMGYSVVDLRATRSASIGSFVSLDKSPVGERVVNSALEASCEMSRLPNRKVSIIRRYVFDMLSVISETERVLRDGGQAIIVVGDSTVAGEYVKNSDIVAVLGDRFRLRLLNRKEREIPPNRRYLPPPTAGGAGKSLQQRMRKEVVMTFTKK